MEQPFGATWNARKRLWNSPLGLIGTRVSAYGTISLGTLYRKSTALKAKGERAGAISKFAKRFRDLCGKKAAGRVWAMRVHQEGRNDLQFCCLKGRRYYLLPTNLAFGTWVARLIAAPLNQRATKASALPKNQRFSGAPRFCTLHSSKA